MDTVRFGVVGLGGMGSFHLAYLDKVEGARVGAVCDVDPERVERNAKKFESLPGGTRVGRFNQYPDLIRSGETPELKTRDKHMRDCYVVAEEGADENAIREAIVSMPNNGWPVTTCTLSTPPTRVPSSL